ncbi:MAG TPA: heme exporter protein CcmD [Rhizomicrobium sp.]|nr:heme exporter protein CcmD [Rhizomicrobium sp.]
MMAKFLAMGGYAAYVWPAYGISFVAIVAAIVLALAAYRRALERARALDARK